MSSQHASAPVSELFDRVVACLDAAGPRPMHA